MSTAYQNGCMQYASSSSLSRDSTLRRPQRPSSFVYDECSGTLRILAPSKAKVHSHTEIDGIAPCDAVFESTSLIAETIQQIDKLGSELDSYCSTAQGTIRSHIRLRSVSGCKPPPPPERRNSTITAATPTAPSVAEIRAGSIAPSDYAPSVVSSSDLGRDQFAFRFP